MHKCSIIIPVYNRAALTGQCLNRLFAHPPESCDFEVIVVDDASRDATPQLLAGHGNRVRVIRHERNMGFATGCNDGAAVAKGEYLVFLNNDTIPLSGWLDSLVRYAEAHPKAVVGSKLLSPNGMIQHAGMVICQDRFPRHVYLGFPANHPAVNKSRRFQVVTGACVLIGREAFARAGGFDTAYINGFEDVDLMLRLGELGYEVHYCHESELYHFESVSEGRTAHNRDNERLYLTRWGNRVLPDEIQYYLDDGLMELNYSSPFRIEFTISPLLGSVWHEEGQSETDRLLNLRSRQAYDLLRENILMRANQEVLPPVTPRAA